ncbi:glycosyltransferase family 2 protein [Vreelandella venusta]|nr:glycosyltransferase family A protein [Halomonas venusta]UQI39347.1 glycosyltransferase family 2 protein [Halomonas venusta]
MPLSSTPDPSCQPEQQKLSQAIDGIEQSPWFDADWYMAHYPDVAASGMSAAQHYLLFGEPWGRQAGPCFDSQFYLKNNQDVANAGVSPLLHFTHNGAKEGRWPPVQLRSQQHEERLWQGLDSTSQLISLKDLLAHQNSWEASYAAWALGRWYAWQGEWQQCADVLAIRHWLADIKPATAAPLLLEIDALTNTGELVAAWQRAQQLEQAFPRYPDTQLALANILAAQANLYMSDEPIVSSSSQAAALSEQQRLQHINNLYRAANLCPLISKDPCQPLTMDNLTVDHQALGNITAADASELVSIIMPLFNAQEHLATALQSLAEQSYRRLEVIVVDDASTDGSLDVAMAFSQQDERFTVISQPRNQGAYAARNRGLAVAKGAFITVHDSDDWSHPQKLAQQVAGLQGHPEWRACFSDWVRCSTNMLFNRWRLEALDGWIYRNTSSFMFRREVVDQLGFWDVVKVDADTEYFQRIVAAFGSKAIGTVGRGTPLSFGRSLPTSLSQAGPTHLVTQFNGVRHSYRQAAAQWHARAKKPSDLYMPAHPDVRPFEAPAANLPS